MIKKSLLLATTASMAFNVCANEDISFSSFHQDMIQLDGRQAQSIDFLDSTILELNQHEGFEYQRILTRNGMNVELESSWNITRTKPNTYEYITTCVANSYNVLYKPGFNYFFCSSTGFNGILNSRRPGVARIKLEATYDDANDSQCDNTKDDRGSFGLSFGSAENAQAMLFKVRCEATEIENTLTIPIQAWVDNKLKIHYLFKGKENNNSIDGVPNNIYARLKVTLDFEFYELQHAD